MSDNESESSCLSALEDVSLTRTLPQAEVNRFARVSYNLYPEVHPDEPIIFEPTTKSNEECSSLEEDSSSQESSRKSSRESSRNSTPVCWQSLVEEPKTELITKKTLPEKDNEQKQDARIDKDPLEKCAVNLDAPSTSKIEDESILKKLLTKHEGDIESPKSEEPLAEHASADESSTEEQKKDESTDETILEEHTDVVESPKSEKSIVEEGLAEQESTVDSPKKETLEECAVEVASPAKSKIEDESILKKLLTKHEGEVESPTKVQQDMGKQQDVVKSPKPEERLDEHASSDESPTKKQKRNEPTDKKHLEEHTDDVESPKSEKSSVEEGLAEQKGAEDSHNKQQKQDARIDQETLNECAIEVESPEKSQIEDESILKKLLTKPESDVESPKSDERLAEHSSSSDESPSKKQKIDKPTDKKILEKHTDDVESPKSEKIIEKSIVEEELPKEKSAEESPNKDQNQDARIDQEALEECAVQVESPSKSKTEDESILKKLLTKPESDVESPKSDGRLAEHASSSDESPSKKQKIDKPTDKKNLEEHTDDVESPKSEKIIEKSIVEEELPEEKSAEESPNKEQNQDARIDQEALEECAVQVESPSKSKIEDESILKKLLTKPESDVESPKSDERLAEHASSSDESPSKKQKIDEPTAETNLEEHTDNVESPKSEKITVKSIVKEELAEQKSAKDSPNKQQKQDTRIHQESPSTSKIEDESILKKLLTKPEGAVESPTKVPQDMAKQQDVVKSPKSEEQLAEHGSSDESPTKKQKIDEPTDKTNLEEHTDNVESPKSEKITEKSIVEEGLAEQKSAKDSPNKQQKQDTRIHQESPSTSKIEDESILKKLLTKPEGAVESPTKVPQDMAKQQDVVKSPKSEEQLAEHGSSDESPTKKQKIDEPTDKTNLEEHTDNVESPKSEKITEKSIVEEGLAEQKSAEESPKKEQKQDARIDKDPLEKCAVKVESPSTSKIEDKSILKKLLTKHEGDVESPKSEETKEELVAKRRLEEHESDVESPTKKVKSPTKQQTTGRETVEEHKDDVGSPKKEEIQDKVVHQATGEERKDNVVLPKPEEKIKCKSIVKDELTKQGSYGKLPTKKQKKDKSINTAVAASSEKEKADVLSDTTKSTSRPSLDKQYFEYILKGFYKNNNIRMDECQGGDASSIQPSFMCDVVKFTLIGIKDYTKKFRLNVIVKLLNTNKEHQELYKSKIAAKNEEIAYNTIFPSLNMYEISLPVPICFFATDEQIIVQDLCGIKYNVFEKKKGFITIKECGYALEALAKFHAATFVLKYKNNDTLQKIKNRTTNILYDGIKKSPLLQHQEDSLQGILSIHNEREQSEENVTKVKALKHLIKVAQEDIKDLICKEQDDYVFCHGDLLLTNFLFKLNNAREKKKEVLPEMDIKLIDFQNIRFGSVASDLVYLLFINLKPEDYIDKKEDLLMRYFNFLKRNIIDSGVGDNFKLTNEWLEKEVDRFIEYGIIYALWILPMFDQNDNKDQSKDVTQEKLDASSKKIVYNERMRKWVDYYSKIYVKKFGK